MSLQLSTEEQNQLQHDILTSKTSSNPLFTSSPVPTMNKALSTTDKRIVGAINELKKENANTLTSLNNNLDGFLNVIGNYNTNPDLLTNLQLIGTDIISIIIAMDTEIKELKKQISGGSTGGGNCEAPTAWKQEWLVYNEDGLYELAYNNISPLNFELTVNGIEYQDCEDFILDATEGTILWKSEEMALDGSDEIVAQYFLEKESALKNPELPNPTKDITI